MNHLPLNLLLADDDVDDCLLFKEVLDELPILTSLNTINDGDELMKLLTKKSNTIPDVLFLDLNMPRKNGFECLSEIKSHQKTKHLPVIIYTTSLDPNIVSLLYEKGAHYYIRKPGDFLRLKNIIHKALTMITPPADLKPLKENFIIEI